MSVPNRVADVVAGRSRIVIVVLLLTTALVGAGMPMVDDDSSLDQFESESPEAEALEDVDDRFVVEEDENTTTVQLIARGDNVLTQESLVGSLEFQQEINANESVTDTLVEDDPITGVENIVAITAITEAEVDEIEAEAEELEEEQAELEAEAEELEERGEAIEADAEELEEERAELEAEQAELEERTAVLEEALNETMALQGEYLEAEAAGDEQGQAAIEAEIQEVQTEAIDDADLDQEQAETFSLATESIRTLVELEAAYEQVPEITDDPESQVILTEALTETRQLEAEGANDQAFQDLWLVAGDDAGLEGPQQDAFEATAEDVRDLQSDLEQIESIELEAAFEEAFELGTMGVFADEFEALEQRGEELEAAGGDLEQRGDELEEDQAELEDASEALEQRGEDLEERQNELEDLDPTLEEQIAALEELDDEEFEDVLVDTLSEDENGEAAALGFMPTDYDPGSTDADARMTMLTQQTDAGDMMGGETDPALDSQLDLRELASEDDQEYLIFGAGIITDEIDRSMGDSLGIVGPLALLFVVIALSVAYRDPLDIALGILGIVGVLVWTFGFMGWAGIAFNQMMIAVPVLLIGLSIDYAIHVFMRHREQRETDDVTGTVRGSMAVALAGVGVALVWVTATTAIGFLANLVSPIGPIQEFGIVSAVGIVAALVIFGGLIPALKVELDSLLESYGWSRRKRAFGTGEGRFTSVLTIGSTAARRIPLVVIVAALLLTAGGVYGASQVDTSFEEEDFLAESPPAWTEHLPGGMSPGEYQAADDLEFVNENFQREDTQTQILVEGDITDDDTLQELSAAQEEAAEGDVVYTLPNGEADVQGPLSVMETTAAENESFNETYQETLNDDDVPDQNLETLYDELFEVNEAEASSVIHRTDDGEYESVLLTVGVQGDASFDEVTDELREIAGTLDASGTGDERNVDAGEGELNAIATGDPIVNHIVEQDLLETVLQSLLVTLVAVFTFLTAAYWLTGNSATLGTVTLLPVAFAVSWILGTMYLLGMPFNVLTGMITSLTIGLGVAYSIHVSARYTLELERQGNAWSAMYTTVTGTGGALLGSAATTVGGFGTLAFAIFPALQQFGIITGLTITYSFIASVIVLPTLLILWTRYFGPDVSFASPGASVGAPTASDGGIETETDTDDDERESRGGDTP
ncbi:MMPL family transporter [Natronolimnohabitans sp. A-GB9]|uniref:MMPL family transporter n=1 Tax=Natronolimnohabitans sp. A-GB9 TaxID=3069757 RepID=UPI0027B3D38B|nr:MMPL family transporter [Natronolimnohabitans sp. A-GB9]MDQ2049511.1 MMPL family transporter [Natronolimnohabitans sp. A-GB9]